MKILMENDEFRFMIGHLIRLDKYKLVEEFVNIPLFVFLLCLNIILTPIRFILFAIWAIYCDMFHQRYRESYRCRRCGYTWHESDNCGIP
jgi:hypothetical protein